MFLIVNSDTQTHPALLHDPKMYPSGSMHMSLITVDTLSDSYDVHQNRYNTDSITLTTPEVLRTSNSKILFPHATNNCLVIRGLWHNAVILFSKNPSRTAMELLFFKSQSLTVWSSLPDAATVFQYVRQLIPSVCPQRLSNFIFFGNSKIKYIYSTSLRLSNRFFFPF